MSEPDDLDDDPGLRSMRSVWREMRDEEPPVRGMAELLAAARAQVAPRPEPGWKRALSAFAAAFRRPPVLALATVVVLIGTGLLIGRRKDASVDATAPVHEERQLEPKQKEPLDTAPRGGADKKGDDFDSKADSDEAKRDVQVQAAPPPAVDPPKPPPAHAVGHAPGLASHHETASTGAGSAAPTTPVVTTESPVASPAPPPPPPPPESTTKPTVDVNGSMDANESVNPTAQEGRDRAPAQQPARPPANTTRGPNKIQQCKDAAARGDCSTAKRIAGEVQREDASGYKVMAKDANVAHCLE